MSHRPATAARRMAQAGGARLGGVAESPRSSGREVEQKQAETARTAVSAPPRREGSACAYRKKKVLPFLRFTRPRAASTQ